MSERLTDEQVAWYAGTSRTAKWTADMAVHENIVTLAREVQEYRALRPTCPTCDGKQWWRHVAQSSPARSWCSSSSSSTSSSTATDEPTRSSSFSRDLQAIAHPVTRANTLRARTVKSSSRSLGSLESIEGVVDSEGMTNRPTEKEISK